MAGNGEIPEENSSLAESESQTFDMDVQEDRNEGLNQEEETLNMDSIEQTLDSDKTERLYRLPLARIKNIMKLDPDFKMTSNEAAVLIAKATELFVKSLTEDAYKSTMRNNRKTLQRKDLDEAIDTVDEYMFLDGALDS